MYKDALHPFAFLTIVFFCLGSMALDSSSIKLRETDFSTAKAAVIDQPPLPKVTLPNGTIIYVHPTDNSDDIIWGDFKKEIPGLSKFYSDVKATRDISGEKNTKLILKKLGDFNSGCYAARICEDLVAFGYKDWYLPSAGEMQYIHEQLGPFTDQNLNFSIDNYWTSSVKDGSYVWAKHFNKEREWNDGEWYFNGKYQANRCRCVRK